MPPGNAPGRRGRFRIPAEFAVAALVFCWIAESHAQAITRVSQLAKVLGTRSQAVADVDLQVTVCAMSRPEIGVLIVHDESGLELLQVGEFSPEIQSGDRIRIHRTSCLLRHREMGVQLSARPIVNNDGLHSLALATANLRLESGRLPIRVEWFNYWRARALDVYFGPTNGRPSLVDFSGLLHAVNTTSGTNFLPGLQAECFEGSWNSLPDFSLLKPSRIGVVTNFNPAFGIRTEGVGIRFSGYVNVPQDGEYRIGVASDDGALVFLGDPNVTIARLGRSSVPAAQRSKLSGAIFTDLQERRWTEVEGHVSFVSETGTGIQFDLGTDRHVISVRVADADGLDINELRNARVRVTGLARPVTTLEDIPVLGKLFAASARDLVFLATESARDIHAPITSVAKVQSLPNQKASEGLPVRIRGTVTGSTKTGHEHWMSFQDDTRGIFVNLISISNLTPAFGESWEVRGRSASGHFAPIVMADEITRIGEGLLPTPVVPTWMELLNGSRDVQWVELKGLVTGVRSNTITLHLQEGRLEVELEGSFENELKAFLKDVVRIRGVLYAVWDAATRQVRVGRVMMRSSTISVEIPAPPNPFDAVVRTPRQLLLFDAQASAFRPVKVRGQIVYRDSTQLFLTSDDTGLRLLAAEEADLRPGDLVEAVGYPDFSRSELMLREALLRKTGEAPLPPPVQLDESSLARAMSGPNRVRLEGRLLGWHDENGAPVLEVQTGNRLYAARLAKAESEPFSLRIGSRLALVGIYVPHGQDRNMPEADNDSFELLLNSMADVTVLSKPPWWTFPRLLAVVGVLLVILIFTIIWNTQLRRLVEQRTTQLRREIRERERIERQHALEAERSRIARDLHDDLGSSLTEISVLASTGQLPQAQQAAQSNLFQAIGKRARGLISALDVIVWAVDPEDNSLQSLADYLTGYTNDFFAHTQISCRFRVPVSCPPITLEGRVRHDLLMAVKEALNNVVRHANATEVEFRLTVVENELEIDIADNGKGIESESAGGGHGLRNLSTRLTKLGGTCTVEPHAAGGTIVRIRLPLTSVSLAREE